MDVDLYQSAINKAKFVAVPLGYEPAGLLALTKDPDFATVHHHNTIRNIQPGDKRVGVDTDTVLANIDADGWSYL
ncbi:hypothetical protein [Dyella sp. 2RAB6]|uniref:hypothetical protein n=1 Tax=Dyella sp. 2RAB6 TaxID=3232992 RepID=UPI003F8E644A